MTTPNIPSPQLLPPPQTGTTAPQLVQLLLSMQNLKLNQQQLQMQREQAAQQATLQYGQLALQQEQFADEQKQRNEQKKGLEELRTGLLEHLKGLQTPAGLEAEISGAVRSGNPALITATAQKIESARVAQQARGIAAKYQGKTDLVSMYEQAQELAMVDPTNPVYAQTAGQLGLALAAPQYEFIYGPTGDLIKANRRTGVASPTGVNVGERSTANLGSAQMIARIAPRVGPLKAAILNLRRIEQEDPNAVEQVASAVAAGNLGKLGPLDIGKSIEAFKGLGFSPKAKEYAMNFYAAVDHLMAMQPNLRAIVQVTFWKNLVVPFPSEAHQPAAMAARWEMRDIMLQGYIDYLQGNSSFQQLAQRAQQLGVAMPPDFGNVPQYSPDNPFKPPEPKP